MSRGTPLQRQTNRAGESRASGLRSQQPIRKFGRRLVSRDADFVALDELSKPGVLTFGELPSPGLDPGDGFVQRALAAAMGDEFLIPEGLAGRSAEGLLAIQQTVDLGDPSGVDHLDDALIDAGVQPVPRRREPVDVAGPFGLGSRMLPLLTGEGQSGEMCDLEGTDDAAEIVRVESCCGDRINAGEPSVEPFRSLSAGFVFELPPELPVCRGTLEDAPEDAPEVQAGAADKQRRPAAGANLLADLGGGTDVLREAELFVRFEDVDQMVRDCGALVRGRFGGPHVHSAIQGHRVERDDLRIESAGQFQGERGLAAGGRPADKTAFPEQVGVDVHAPSWTEGDQRNFA